MGRVEEGPCSQGVRGSKNWKAYFSHSFQAKGGTALDFVLEHGEEYGLYEPFLNKTSTYDPNRETKLEKKLLLI